MHIGILQTGLMADALKGKYPEYPIMFENLLAGQGFTFSTYAVVNNEFPKDVQDCDGWLITGSRHGSYEDLHFIAPLEDFIRAAYAADVPLVGICFGHQIIAQALGGRVEKFGGGWSVGLQTYDFEGKKISLNAWHQDQVVERPADATLCGTSDFCENAALVYGRRAYTVQAHPEYDGAFISDLAEVRGRGVVPDPLIAEAQAKATAATDSALLAARIGRFFRERIAA